jgi:hypothetical protein
MLKEILNEHVLINPSQNFDQEKPFVSAVLILRVS